MRSFLVKVGLVGVAASIHNPDVWATEIAPFSAEQMRQCLQQSVLTADKSMTVHKLEEACTSLLSQSSQPTLQSAANEKSPSDFESITIKNTNNMDSEPNKRMLRDRSLQESLNRTNRFVLTPHKRNYILPVSYTNSPNIAPYDQALVNGENEESLAFSNLQRTEFEFQLSVKLLLRENLFDDNGHLYLGYTNHSLWQVYNKKTSSPFRETNHQPELILSFTNDFEIFGFRNVLNEVSISHQSNGQSSALSRSWNRVMLNSVFEGDNFSFALSPWYRLPESNSDYPGDPKGDDNPDISHYMGNFQFTGAYEYKSNIFSVELRNNLESDNRGAVELGWTFPLTPTMRGYLTYFDGYGHTLIDYNAKQQVIGLGITFADLF